LYPLPEPSDVVPGFGYLVEDTGIPAPTFKETLPPGVTGNPGL
jgi:hypothetical protein